MSELVTVRLFAAARAAAGVAEATVSAGSVADIGAQLVRAHPQLAGVLPLCSFLVDGRVAKPPFDGHVPAGSTLDVLPPFAGG